MCGVKGKRGDLTMGLLHHSELVLLAASFVGFVLPAMSMWRMAVRSYIGAQA